MTETPKSNSQRAKRIGRGKMAGERGSFGGEGRKMASRTKQKPREVWKTKGPCVRNNLKQEQEQYRNKKEE